MAAAILGAALACTAADERSVSEPSSAELPIAPQETVAEPQAPVAPLPAPEAMPEPSPPTPESASAAAPATPSLEDLLRVPPPVVPVDPLTGRPLGIPKGGATPQEKKYPQRVNVELKKRDTQSKVRSRSRTDAGVAVDVSEGVRLRGGVRVEEESGREAEDPIPTVGIEKRF